MAAQQLFTAHPYRPLSEPSLTVFSAAYTQANVYKVVEWTKF